LSTRRALAFSLSDDSDGLPDALATCAATGVLILLLVDKARPGVVDPGLLVLRRAIFHFLGVVIARRCLRYVV